MLASCLALVLAPQQFGLTAEGGNRIVDGWVKSYVRVAFKSDTGDSWKQEFDYDYQMPQFHKDLKQRLVAWSPRPASSTFNSYYLKVDESGDTYHLVCLVDVFFRYKERFHFKGMDYSIRVAQIVKNGLIVYSGESLKFRYFKLVLSDDGVVVKMIQLRAPHYEAHHATG